jgi:hypothetical protein
MRPQTKPMYGKPAKGAMEQMPVVRNDMKGNGFTPYAAGKKYYGTRREALMRRMGKAT